MFFFRLFTPDSPATGSAGQPTRDRREDGEADVVDVPQADGNSAVDPAPVVRTIERPAKPVDNRARSWRGR